MAGLLLLAYPAWLAGSLGVPVTRGPLLAALLLLAAAGAGRGLAATSAMICCRLSCASGAATCCALRAWRWPSSWLSWLVRAGQPRPVAPDLGRRKADGLLVLQRRAEEHTFPPYDPWFAGGLMNYYYYGFVLVGMPVKLLGITPAVAYNLMLPALFSLVALAAFSIAWNLTAARREAPAAAAQPAGSVPPWPGRLPRPHWVGLAAAGCCWSWATRARCACTGRACSGWRSRNKSSS
jgi:hypothetical protein